MYSFEALTFNIHGGYLEAIVRGYRSGLLPAADYNNLCQCETLDDIKMHLSATEYGTYLQNELEHIWNSKDRKDPCSTRWMGVHCYNKTFDDGYLHVRELELMNMNLSGTLAPELGLLSRMKVLNVMWNNIGGSIPKEIGNLTNLELLLLNGNQLTGSLPDELGYLPHLDRIQIDQNQISGTIPKSFANLNKTQHFHMNNNSISGEIPRELSRLPRLIHFLLDNNNLSGSLPAEFSELPNLLILQLDNNNFSGSGIPASYGKMNKLLKLSLRNCGLKGSIPDHSYATYRNLSYIDLSLNQLIGPIPPEKLSDNMTTIILSHNSLNGTIPQNFSSLHRLQKLSLDNNLLNGSVPSTLWESTRSTTAPNLTMDFQNNTLTEFSGRSSVPANVTEISAVAKETSESGIVLVEVDSCYQWWMERRWRPMLHRL